jgi:hypothetical protein
LVLGNNKKANLRAIKPPRVSICTLALGNNNKKADLRAIKTPELDSEALSYRHIQRERHSDGVL